MPTINVVGGIRLLGGQVSMPFVNIPPTWDTSTGSLGSIKEFDTITSGNFVILAVDPDNLPVTPVVYDIIAGALPTGASLNANTGAITGPAVPVATDTVFSFTARVQDGQDQITRDFSITVFDNIAPVWTTPAGDLGSRHEAETITSGNFTVIATDADSGPGSIVYSVSAGALPTSASLDSSTGDITGPAVVIASDTTYNFTIDASDTDKATSRAFSIIVDNNTVPVWQTSNASPLATVDVGDSVNVSVNATDADNLPIALTYSVSVGVLPTGLSLNPSSGAITGTVTVPTEDPFTVEADDGLDVTTRQFQIIVNIATLQQAIEAAGLATGLNLVLDSGDSSSYSGSGQDWVDTSVFANADEFHRGTTTGADSTDPTFNGVAGANSSSEFWSSDGGDFFKYGASNETWMENIHKNGAVYSIMAVIYVGGTSSAFAGTRGGTQEIGWAFPQILNAGPMRLHIINTPGGGAVFNAQTDINWPLNEWNFVGCSINENGGAGAGFLYKDGDFLQVGGGNTFNPSYSNPSSSSASKVMEIMAMGGGNTPVKSGSRIALFSVWNVALTKTNFDDLFELVRDRFGL